MYQDYGAERPAFTDVCSRSQDPPNGYPWRCLHLPTHGRLQYSSVSHHRFVSRNADLPFTISRRCSVVWLRSTTLDARHDS